MQGVTLDEDHTTREILVCGPAAFIVLKAIAFRGRGAPKDAYDLAYVLRYFGEGPTDIAKRFKAFSDDEAAKKAKMILRSDFSEEQNLGPRSASRFRFNRVNDEYVADIVGDIGLFLLSVERE